MKRLLALLLLALPAWGQVSVPGAPCKITDGSCAGGGSSTPGGSDTQLQYNKAGSFAGALGLTYTDTVGALTLTPLADAVPFTVRAWSSGTNHIAQFQDSSNGFLAGITHGGGLMSSALTAGRVLIVGTSGLITDDAGLTYDAGTDTLTVGQYVDTTVVRATNVYAVNAIFSLQHQTRYDGQFLFTGTVDVGGTPDSGLRRVSAGLVGVTNGSTGNGALQTGGVQYVTGSRPTCDAAVRGMTWYVAGGAGVADTFEVCRKDAADAYAWVTLF